MELTVKDIAAAIGVQEETIHRWISDGSLPAQDVNGQFRMNRTDLLEWATTNRLAVNPEKLAHPQQHPEPEVTIAEALSLGGIHFGVKGTDHTEVLANIVKALPLPKSVDRAFLLSVLLAREALGSTGIGNGIAIPHVRNPMVFDVQAPFMALCFLDKPIEFGAVDNKPVDTMFLLVCPTIAMHLHVLSLLSFLLKDKRLVKVLAKRAEGPTILESIRVVEKELLAARAARPQTTP